MRELILFSGSANKELSREISEYLGVPLSSIDIKRFADGEIYVRINENVRGRDVYIIQPTCKPVNESIMELSIIIDALRRASASTITAVMPYFGYARQDRKAKSREPITSKLVANLLTQAGVSRIITVDLHSGQIQGFFDIPLDHIYALNVLSDYIQKKNLKNIVVVAPDAGGVKKARRLAKILDVPLAIIDKRRPAPNVAEVSNIIGDIKGKTAIMIDDMVDTGGTICGAAYALAENGATEIYVCATHALLSGPAVERFEKAPIKEAIFTNTIPIPKEKMIKKIKVVSIAPLLAEVIKKIHNRESVSEMFEKIEG